MSVRLVDLSLPVLEALAASGIDAAAEELGFAIPADFAEDTGLWGYFAGCLRDVPSSAGWLIHAVVSDDVIVGSAGFKAAPSESGEVEIGYATLPAHRRRGFAVAAVRVLLERAEHHCDVRSVRAEAGVGNLASIAVLIRTGFELEGERVDVDDGRLLCFANIPTRIGDERLPTWQ